MSIDKNDLPKDVRLVHALMQLRNVGPHDLALHTGVQIENLHAWLQGTASALAHRSYIALLSYLGLTRDGLSKTYVQNWEMDVRQKFNSSQLEALEHVAPWLVGGTMIEIMGEWQPLYGKTRIFAIRGDNFKVLLALKGALRMPCSLQPAMVPGISYRTTPDNKPPEIRVDPMYWNAVRNKSVTPAEFDDLFFETALECSWNDLRLMARERGITPSMLAKDVLAKDMSLDANVVAKVEVRAQKEASVEAANSVSTPAKARRRAPAERVTVAAPAEQVEAKKAMTIPLSLGRNGGKIESNSNAVGERSSSTTNAPLSGAFVSVGIPSAPEVSFEPSADNLPVDLASFSMPRNEELPVMQPNYRRSDN